MTRDLVASVIVPARDAGDDLQHLLHALSLQTVSRERFEVVIGDDGSTDGSTHALPSENGWVHVSRGEPLTSYAARNRAVRTSRASVLAFLDADCRPEPAWLESGLAWLEEADVVGGTVLRLAPPRPTIWTLLDIDFFVDQERAISFGYALGGNLFVRRELFDRVGGFDESLPSGGDYDFVARCAKAGARIAYAPEAIAWHPTRNDGRAFLRKLWLVASCNGARARRAGRRPPAVKPWSWLPVLPVLHSRRTTGRTVGLDRQRLAANGVTLRRRDNLRALALIYLVLPYLARAAQLRGWLRAGRAG